MASTSIGLIETRGLTASIEAADAMLKAADVELMGTEKIGSGGGSCEGRDRGGAGGSLQNR